VEVFVVLLALLQVVLEVEHRGEHHVGGGPSCQREWLHHRSEGLMLYEVLAVVREERIPLLLTSLRLLRLHVGVVVGRQQLIEGQGLVNGNLDRLVLGVRDHIGRWDLNGFSSCYGAQPLLLFDEDIFGIVEALVALRSVRVLIVDCLLPRELLGPDRSMEDGSWGSRGSVDPAVVKCYLSAASFADLLLDQIDLIFELLGPDDILFGEGLQIQRLVNGRCLSGVLRCVLLQVLQILGVCRERGQPVEDPHETVLRLQVILVGTQGLSFIRRSKGRQLVGSRVAFRFEVALGVALLGVLDFNRWLVLLAGLDNSYLRFKLGDELSVGTVDLGEVFP